MRATLVACCLLLLTVPLSAENVGPALEASPETVAKLEAMHQQADGMVATNDFRGAIRTYLEILILEPDDETAYVNMGTCQLILGEYHKAEDSYRNALAINPENEAAQTGLRRIKDPDSAQFEAPESGEDQETAQPPAWLARDPHAQPMIQVKPTEDLEEEARQLQQYLKDQGYYKGEIDGIIGDGSRRAIRAFQAAQGLRVDGIAGPKTWAALKTHDEKKT